MKEQARVFGLKGESYLSGASTPMQYRKMDKEKIFCKKALKGEMKKISLEGKNGDLACTDIEEIYAIELRIYRH